MTLVLFHHFFVLSCFTENGNHMTLLIAPKQYINYETAAHYANKERSHDYFKKKKKHPVIFFC